MKERPILFSAPMVRAIMAGTKMQTRRVVKPQFSADAVPAEMPATDPIGGWVVGGHSGVWWCDAAANPDESKRCPYGQPGDRLWVREAWGYFDPDSAGEDYDNEHESAGHGPVAFCDELLQEGHPLRDFWRRRVAYKATFAEQKYGLGPVGPKKWRPSIHMPRWASRITLEVTGVRVERLQDISEADSVAEGIPSGEVSPPDAGRFAYRLLWESINGPGSWGANPWVWVVELRHLPNHQISGACVR